MVEENSELNNQIEGQTPNEPVELQPTELVEESPAAPTPSEPTEVQSAEVSEPLPNQPREDPLKPHRFKKWWLKLKQKPWLIALIVVVLVGGAAAAGYFWHPFSHHPAAPTVKPTVKQTAPAKPVTKESPLTGLPVAPDLADRPITAVVIENHTDARPQSGLNQAGVVYEALAEGGITRFLAFFLDQRPNVLGPVRSLRTYFIDWALEFNAPVAHAGGNADALDLVPPLGMKDMNEFTFGSYFYRTHDRFAPHNLYTSSDLLDKLERALNFAKPASFTVSPRKVDQPSAAPAAGTININYSYASYGVQYRYEQTGNDYVRYLAGTPHVDRNTGQPIKVKNVVVEYMPTAYGLTRIGEQTVIMQTVGQGKALVFRDGGVVTGTWRKSTHSARTQLIDDTGQAIPLDAGNTWYSIVPPTGAATYQ